MIELASITISAAFGIALLIEGVKRRQLEEENRQLQKRLLAVRRKHRAELELTESSLNNTIGQLQMALFQRDEQISDLRAKIKSKNQLIKQRWADARGTQNGSAL